MSNSKKILATGDDYGLVKLFKYPCTVEKAKYQKFSGHSSHVCKIRFSKLDKFLISVGGNDKCVFIWETDFPMEGGADDGDNYGGGNEAHDDNKDNYEDEEEVVDTKPKKSMPKKIKQESEPEDEEEEVKTKKKSKPKPKRKKPDSEEEYD